MSRWINRDRTDSHWFLRLVGRAATKDRFDSQDHFARTKRLGDVIVRAEFESNDAIDLFRAGSQHQNRNVARRQLALQDFAHLESGHFGQHQIENDDVRFFVARFGEAGGAVIRD